MPPSRLAERGRRTVICYRCPRCSEEWSVQPVIRTHMDGRSVKGCPKGWWLGRLDRVRRKD